MARRDDTFIQDEWHRPSPLITLDDEDRRRVERIIRHTLMHTEIDNIVTIKSADALADEIMKWLLPSWRPAEDEEPENLRTKAERMSTEFTSRLLEEQ